MNRHQLLQLITAIFVFLFAVPTYSDNKVGLPPTGLAANKINTNQSNKESSRKFTSRFGQVHRNVNRNKKRAVPQSTQPKRLWNLQNADILAVIAAVAKETGKNFIVDPKVQGNITIISTAPIDSNELYQVFLSALGILGFSAVPSGDVIKIVPNLTAKTLSTPVASEYNPGQGDQLVVRVIPIKNVSATELVPILQPLMPEWGTLAAYRPANALILAGRAANISRMAKIISRVDMESPSSVDVIPLHHANAEKVASTLINLQNANRALGKVSNIAIAANQESNSILISGNRRGRLRMRALIADLDIPRAASAGIRTRVFHLNYLEAKKLAPILAKIARSAYIEEQTKQAAEKGKTASATAETLDTAVAGSNKKVSIQAAPAVNAIIISAPPGVLRTLAAVIHQLDRKPHEVLVEAIIARVDENVANQLGVLWNYDATQNDNNNNNIIPTGSSEPVSGTSSSSSGEEFGIQPGIGIITHRDLTVVVAALMSSNGADILSTPSEVVLNNQKATIADGVNIGVPASKQFSDSSGVPITPFTTFNRTNVGLKLTVTPQISPNQNVRLKIELDNNSLQNPQDPGANPIYNTSKIQTTVMVHSGDILVLGGLISHDTSKTVDKIPILGDIPILGQLFRFNQKEAQKKDLMVFLKPIILGSRQQSQKLTNERYNFIRSQQLMHIRGERTTTDVFDEHSSTLPSWYLKKQVTLPPPFPAPEQQR